MKDKYSEDFLLGFKVALMINGNWNETITNEKIAKLVDKFTDAANKALDKVENHKPVFEKKQTFLKVAGKDYYCPCGSCLFIQYEEDKWKCNNCENYFESETTTL